MLHSRTRHVDSTYPLSAPHSPRRYHAEDSQEEAVSCHAIALMALVGPQVLGLHVQRGRVSRPVDLIGMNIVFLLEEPSDHGVD